MSFLDVPSSVLNLGPRGHSALIAGREKEVAGMLAASGWRCCKCGVAVKGAMEVHHPDGHSPTARLGAICTFCHFAEHAGWAAARKLIVPIWSPDFGQADLSRLFWGLSLSGCVTDRSGDDADPDAVRSVARVMRDVARRSSAAADIIGADSADSVIESLFRMRSVRGRSASMDARIDAHVSRILAGLRWAPASIAAPSEMRATFLAWDVGGLKSADDAVSKLILDEAGETGEADLRRLGADHVGPLPDLPEPEIADESFDSPAFDDSISDIDWANDDMDGL